MINIYSIDILQQYNLCHNDVKPGNFLVQWVGNRIQNLKIYLSDFGLVDRMGGTPTFASTEFSGNRLPGVSDLFSLGRLFTFMITEDKTVFYKLIFLPVKLQNHQTTINRIISGVPLLNLIQKMTKILPTERCSINDVLQELGSVNDFNLISMSDLEAKGYPIDHIEVVPSIWEIEDILLQR